MNKLEIIINNNQYSMTLDKFKIVLGDNFSNQFIIYNALNCYFKKVSYSEYYKNNFNNLSVKFNGLNIDIRSTLFFNLEFTFDYISDMKMTSKSLLLKYYETILEDIEYDETFNSVKQYFSSYISADLNELTELNIENINLYQEEKYFNYKTLINLFTPVLLKKQLEINNIDFSYEEIIVFQLELLNKIAEKSENDLFVVANIPYVTDLIYKHVRDINEKIKLIILSSSYNPKIDLNNYIFSDLSWLDFADEENVYNYLLHSPFTYQLDTFRNYFTDCLKEFQLKNFLFKK